MSFETEEELSLCLAWVTSPGMPNWGGGAGSRYICTPKTHVRCNLRGSWRACPLQGKKNEMICQLSFLFCSHPRSSNPPFFPLARPASSGVSAWHVATWKGWKRFPPCSGVEFCPCLTAAQPVRRIGRGGGGSGVIDPISWYDCFELCRAAC